MTGYTPEGQQSLVELQSAITQLNGAVTSSPNKAMQFLQSGGDNSTIDTLTGQIQALTAQINAFPPA